MPSLRIRLFGSPQVTVDGTPADITRDKSLALLIYLAVTQGTQRRDRLAALLWPETGQDAARSYLRNALYTLSRTLGPGWFQTDRRQVALEPGADWRTDVQEFEAQVAAANADPAAAVNPLSRAAVLAQDEFLAGFSLPDAPEFEEWLLFERESLHRKLDGVLQSLVAHHRQQGELSQAIDYARRWVALDPLHEPAHCALMQLYATSGEKAAALRQYAEVACLLREELDAEPSDETQNLYEEVRLDHLEAPARPPPAGGQPFSHHLPHPPTPLVGRQRDLAELDALLEAEDGRLITILGPGGMGKTRLALACAERQVQRRCFAHGVFFVPLAPVRSVDHIASTIAGVTGCVLQSETVSGRSPAQQIVDYLRDKQVLLLLDSFEHLLPGAALVHDILAGAPDVRALVTSRERLHMLAEHTYPIGGLTTGDPSCVDSALDSDAVRLFVQCASRTAPDCVLDADDLNHAGHICRLVVGMPLAIELAASWVDLLSPAEIAREIRCSLDFLEADMQDAPPRHHSIRAVFDTTWQSLDAAEQGVFAALSVFHGGFTREAAREVAGATLHQLNSLAGKSLVQPDRRGHNGHYRYAIHELLRQYAASMLARSADAVPRTQERHCAYYTGFLHARLPTIHGPDQAQAVADISEELDNVRVAWQWAVDAADAEAIHLAATTFFLYCQLRSLFLEGAEAMAAAADSLQKVDPSPQRDATLAQVLNHEGWLRIRVGAIDRATAALEASRTLYAQSNIPPPPPHMGSDPISPLAMIAQTRGEYARAAELGEEALHAAVLRGDLYNQSYAHYALTSVRAAQGDLDAAARHAQQACELAQAVGNRWFSAIPRNEWGRVARAAGDLEQAKLHFRLSHDIMGEYRDREGMAVALNELGEVAILEHDFAEADRLYHAALNMYQGISDRVGRATALTGLGRVAYAQGKHAAARNLYVQALDMATETEFLPLTFAIFVHAGELLLASGRVTAGVRAVVQAQQHPAVYHETRAQASRTLECWRAAKDQELFHIAIQKAQGEDIDATVTLLRAELAALGQTPET